MLGRHALGASLQHARPRSSSWRAAVQARSRRPACQAASTLSNGESEAAPAASKASASKPAATQTGSAREQQPAASTSASSADTAGAASAAGSRTPFLTSPALMRRLSAAALPIDVADALGEEALVGSLREDAACEVVMFYLQRGKVQLALALYREMCFARRGGAAMRSMDVAFTWPAATLATTTQLVLGLCQQLCIVEALQVLADIRVQGLPRGSEEVGFGKVIISPLAPDRPLTVVQPQEGGKTVADCYSRYEYDVFSGTTLTCSSTALVPSGNLLLGLGRMLGLVKKPAVAAIHEFVLQAPDSTSRTFRVGTETAAVPAQVGERVTVVSAPMRNVRQGGLFNASPPGTKPGEAMTATNHRTGTVLPLLRPPVSAELAGVPGWVLPLAVVLAGGDAASSLLDPALPLLLAAGATTLATSTLVGSSVLLPRLKQLPDGKVRVEYLRQQLLGQYSALTSKAASVVAESADDVRVLARLWQLQNKMEAVTASAGPSPFSISPFAAAAAAVAGGAAAAAASGAGVGSMDAPSTSGSASWGVGSGVAAYEARISRVSRARDNIEERLARKVELLDGYSRVMNMIEIEVEMDIEVPAAEMAGIQQQLERLVELESLQEDWRAQAEARDEVERLLRAT